ncbi:MAG: hypothetical protein HW406_920 [Candidatus Brocadiaceae bacterium]|nr:hypothetical protein [Candidatus Brocadiaceae bacterium]
MVKKYIVIYLAILTILAVTTRLIFLEKSPPGFYADEVSFGYNAMSIMESGRDEYGITFPVYFKAFGEYKNPIYCYSIIPFLKIFGISVFAVRATSAFWGIATIVLMFFVVKNYLNDVHTAFFSSLILTFMPWHLIVSRIAFEVVTLPFFILLSLYFWEKYLRSLKIQFVFIACFCMGVCFYTYSTSRVLVPLYCLGSFVIWFKEINKKKFAYPAAIFGILLPLIPLFFWLQKYPDTFTHRFSEVSIWNHKFHYLKNILNIFLNYVDDFSIKYLFISGDANLRHSTGRSGALLISYSLFALFGILLIWQRRNDKFLRFVIFGFLTFPFAASLTKESFHALRSANAIPFISIILGVGLRFLLECLNKYKNIYRLGLVSIALLVSIEFFHFYWDYLIMYPARSESRFLYSIPETMEFVMSQKADNFYFTPSVGQPLIMAKFFSRSKNSLYKNSDFHNFHVVKNFAEIFTPHSYLLTAGNEKPSKGFKKIKEFKKIYSPDVAYTLYYIETDNPIAPIQITSQELEMGLIANYFYGTECKGKPFLTKVEPGYISFTFNKESKPYKVPFSIEWVGYIQISKNGIYKFATRSDDGSQVYINGRIIVDNGGRHPLRYGFGNILLDKGLYHIKIIYFDSGGESAMELLWTSPEDIGKEYLIPADVLFHKK